jgi:hypothetical protein
MMNKIRVTLAIIILVICCIDGFARDSQSLEQEKIDQVMNKLWSLRSGGWGSYRAPYKEAEG